MNRKELYKGKESGCPGCGKGKCDDINNDAPCQFCGYKPHCCYECDHMKYYMGGCVHPNAIWYCERQHWCTQIEDFTHESAEDVPASSKISLFKYKDYLDKPDCVGDYMPINNFQTLGKKLATFNES
jgi:hypothetical protein